MPGRSPLAAGQVLDRYHHRAPVHRRVADQDRAVAAVGRRHRPAAASRCLRSRTAPAGPAPGALAATSCVEVQRLVNSSGIITLANQVIAVGSPLAGQRARIRLDGQVMHVLTQDGILWRTLPCPIPPAERHKLQGVRLAGPQPLPPPARSSSAGYPAAAARPRRTRGAQTPAAAGVWWFREPRRRHPDVAIRGGPVPAVARIIEELHHHGAERSSDDLTGAGDSQAGRWRR